MAHAITLLPHQSDVHAKQFAEHTGLFENDVFGPTREDAAVYKQVPSPADMCTLSALDEQDPSSDFVIRHLKSTNLRLKKIVSQIMGHRKPGCGAVPRKSVALDVIHMAVNVFTAVYVPVLFAGSLGVLSCLKSEKSRILALGAFGLLLTMSLILSVPKLKRNDIFAITAAFFAVGGVYIGAKGDGRN